MDYDLAHETVRDFECGQCGGRLVLSWNAETKEYDVYCAKDRQHQGYRPIQSLSEEYRQGVPLPMAIVNTIERGRPPVRSVDVMAGIWQERFRTLTPAGAYQAALYSLQLGLDPRFGEVACIEFRSPGGKLPVVMITSRGWRTLAARHAPEFTHAPIIRDVTAPEAKLAYGATAEDFVATASGRLVGDGPNLERVSVGIYTRGEMEDALSQARTSGRHPVPAVTWPQNQARRRAERHWYEENLPHIPERARQAWQDVLASLNTERANQVIEAEFSVVDRLPVRSQQAHTPTARSPKEIPRVTEKQKNALYRLGQAKFGYDASQVEGWVLSRRDKPLDELSVQEAGEIIDLWQNQ